MPQFVQIGDFFDLNKRKLNMFSKLTTERRLRTEDDAKELMKSEAYKNSSHKDFKATKAKVKEIFDGLYPEPKKETEQEMESRIFSKARTEIGSPKGLGLGESVSSTYANLDDTPKIKLGLQKLGYYNKPKYGMNEFPDTPMFEGITKFQKDNNLKVDGKINPDGETLKFMNNQIKMSMSKDTGNSRPQSISSKVINNMYPAPLTIVKTIQEGFANAKNFKTIEKETGKGYSDKYKHAYISHKGAENGLVGAATIGAMGAGREVLQVISGKNTPKDALKDMDANIYGIKNGLFNTKESADASIQKKYKKHPK